MSILKPGFISYDLGQAKLGEEHFFLLCYLFQSLYIFVWYLCTWTRTTTMKYSLKCFWTWQKIQLQLKNIESEDLANKVELCVGVWECVRWTGVIYLLNIFRIHNIYVIYLKSINFSAIQIRGSFHKISEIQAEICVMW